MKRNKFKLHQSILHALESVKIAAFESAQTAHNNATHTENIADNKYGTLALEEAYLAFGQTQRVIECDENIETFKALKVIDFAQDDEIKLGALICVETNNSIPHAYYFLSPCSGGVKFMFDGLDITLITPTAPLGKLLLGKQADDEIVLNVVSALNTGEQVMTVLQVK